MRKSLMRNNMRRSRSFPSALVIRRNGNANQANTDGFILANWLRQAVAGISFQIARSPIVGVAERRALTCPFANIANDIAQTKLICAKGIFPAVFFDVIREKPYC